MNIRYTGSFGTHATTSRYIYTVPAGKCAWLKSASVLLEGAAAIAVGVNGIIQAGPSVPYPLDYLIASGDGARIRIAQHCLFGDLLFPAGYQIRYLTTNGAAPGITYYFHAYIYESV